jgi:hypothetical protein
MQGLNGKLDDLIFYQMYDKTYVRSKPVKIRDPKSIKQIIQRERMQMITQFLKPYKALLRFTFASQAVGKAPYHAAKSYNMLHGIKGYWPNFELDKTKLRICKGVLQEAVCIGMEVNSNKLLIQWDPVYYANNKHYWQCLLIIATTNNYCKYEFTQVPRHQGEFTWETPNFNLVDVDVWMAFYVPHTTAVSDSLYLGHV